MVDHMEKIDIRNITEINDDGIVYRNEQGKAAFIELAPCVENFAKEYGIDKEQMRYRCVGIRCFGVLSDYAYFELFTKEHTQIYIKLKTNPLKRFITKVVGWNFHTKEYGLFYSVQKALLSHGWSTYDLG